MTGFLLDFPSDVPWTILTASPDMMDPTFGNRGFPSPWRTSIAISAYEPPDEDQHALDCGQRIAFLKVTCTLTGYTPSADEIQNGYAALPDTVTELQAVNLLGAYYGCYGALVNVSVFPHGDDEGSIARIVDFEPKMRDLYQAASDVGEVLTGSSAEVNTSKSATHTSSSQMGLSHTGKWSSGQTPAGEFEASHTIAGEWGSTDQDSSQLSIDASADRRERWGTTTYLSQLYNLLTGYHAGTNRAAFLLLPRPHQLQPTNRRTFVQGVRVIEGVQEFFMIVTRPSSSDGLCVDVALDTGHYPEDVTVIPPSDPREVVPLDFRVLASARSDIGTQGHVTDLALEPLSKFTLPGGFEIDRFNPMSDPLHPGVMELAVRDNTQSRQTLTGYNYQAVSDTVVQIIGTIHGASNTVTGGQADFDRDYRVFAKRTQPGPPSGADGRVTSRMLIVTRGLATCYSVDDGCLRVVSDSGDSGDSDEPARLGGPWVADELPVEFGVGAQGGSVGVPPGEVLRGTRDAMIASLRLSSRRSGEGRGFLGSDVFGRNLAAYLPEEALGRHAKTSRGDITIGDLLRTSTLDLTRRRGLAPEEVAKMRQETVIDLGERGRGFHSREPDADAQ